MTNDDLFLATKLCVGLPQSSTLESWSNDVLLSFCGTFTWHEVGRYEFKRKASSLEGF